MAISSRAPMRRGTEMGVLLLIYQLWQFGFDRVPPVTLGMIGFMAAAYIGLVPMLDPARTGAMCVHAGRIIHKKEWIRLFAPAFMHADDMHLYFNMVSLLWKGHRLERKFGSAYFAYVLLVFAALCNVLMVAIAFVMEEHLHMTQFGLMRQCAVGFSGVLFALKVLSNHYYPHGDHRFFGWLPFPSRYASWAELFLIQILVPNASFTGHLCGILVGSAYVYGPLKKIMDSAWTIVTGSSRYTEQYGDSQYYGGGDGQPYRRSPAAAAYSRAGAQPRYNPKSVTYYTGGMSEEEQMRRALEQSSHFYPGGEDPPRTSYGWR